MSKFYLVQRLESKPAPHDRSRGFDGFFWLDYMGSSEFERGAIPSALKEMRTKRAVIETQTVRIDGLAHDIYFVGHKGVSRAGDAMEQWAAGTEERRPFFGKDWTHFPEVLAGQHARYVRTDAWWDIENNVAGAIDRGVAELLVKAFNTRPEGR